MNDEMKGIVIASLFGAIGFMWVVGGIAIILAGFEEHWALGWLSFVCLGLGMYRSCVLFQSTAVFLEMPQRIESGH